MENKTSVGIGILIFSILAFAMISWKNARVIDSAHSSGGNFFLMGILIVVVMVTILIITLDRED